MIYLDNAATTKPCRAAKDAVLKGLEQFGNPSSLHGLGLEAELLISGARETIASTLKCLPEELTFTSCATESSNTAILGAFKSQGKRRHRVVTTTVEHPATARPVDELERLGCEVIRVSPREDGTFDPQDFIDAVNDDTLLVTMMLVNNETGAILPVEEVFSAVKKRSPQTLTHCDAVQGYMKLPFTVKSLGADLISLSAHKIYGPKGVGALYIRKGLHIPPLLLGGGQEKAQRSGTESVPLIAGFGAAAGELSLTQSQDLKRAGELEAYLKEKCLENGSIAWNLPQGVRKSPWVNSIAVEGLRSEVLLHFLEREGIYVSSGSACSKGKKSGVLEQFGVSPKAADTTLRISFSRETSEQDIDALMEAIRKAQGSLARIR